MKKLLFLVLLLSGNALFGADSAALTEYQEGTVTVETAVANALPYLEVLDREKFREGNFRKPDQFEAYLDSLDDDTLAAVLDCPIFCKAVRSLRQARSYKLKGVDRYPKDKDAFLGMANDIACKLAVIDLQRGYFSKVQHNHFEYVAHQSDDGISFGDKLTFFSSLHDLSLFQEYLENNSSDYLDRYSTVFDKRQVELLQQDEERLSDLVMEIIRGGTTAEKNAIIRLGHKARVIYDAMFKLREENHSECVKSYFKQQNRERFRREGEIARVAIEQGRYSRNKQDDKMFNA